MRAREYACVSVRADVYVYLRASIYMYNINVQNIFCISAKYINIVNLINRWLKEREMLVNYTYIE